MTTINNLTLDTPEPTAAKAFHTALGVDAHITARDADAPTTGFPGFTLSLVVSQPNIVDAYIEAALDNGGATITPAKKSLWGYGGVVQGPDGALWKIATSSKKNTGPATRHFEDLVLLLGVGDVKAGKQFYLDHGLEVTRSFGRKYVEFATGPKVKLALYGRRALAKDAGISPDGTGAHRIVIRSDAGTFTDPDGFSWESD
ncbi:glyoxalase [Rhodococcus oxybenzonivorans]|uniref:Glyoxalase n=1 Tax=Rhodococcus oxybenzonivorans TaxID=1990687 RepID=A0A2S2BW43_9NOCA|nr:MULTISPECIES: glyoxalase [Rhodococcus]AWK72865.1 glyoxalase [Rhodococcus oxybenzonivorans]QTJ69431.1 glyoxalase [Rhodococcus sp. ZPP]